jgi:hypothetical protein
VHFFPGVKIKAENESKSGAFIRGPERIRIRIRIGVGYLLSLVQRQENAT